MICPSCKCEYIPGVRECADCGVALVDALDAPPTNPPGDGGLVSIWWGDDPGEYASVKQSLEKAGITFTDQSFAAYFIFPSLRLKNEIWVSTADQQRAEKVLLDLEGRVDPDELTPEELESLALPESNDDGQDQDTPTPSEISADWDGEDLGSEVWTGDNEELANTLGACLREIGIPSRKTGEAGAWKLLVPTQEEARAKEIVREVVEASPPH
jgi:hypothetical protein